jgi:alpha-amylase/alpha-mannosidase (GH57 family)
MSDRFICIHGHFYQPPRENPWLEDVEVQDSASPYHDWNERIADECYAPNSVARILDRDGRITDLVSNYEKMSFNFGPTLLSWLERHRLDVYREILEADRTSQSSNSGHGNAIAQCYNHIIMPLASARDKLTQVRWGIADFQHRFGREPEGMWLPETAVDLATLEVLAGHGIKFTILAPSQAEAVRAPGAGWQDVTPARIDPTRAYRCGLGEGRHIDLFFYDAPVSHDLAFAGLLRDGQTLVDRLMQGFHSGRKHAQLMHVATDGETFGHHAKFGEMALAYAIKKIEREGLARVTNYAAYLALHPPEYEVRIRENTSWSCSHGVERWRSDCGCNSGTHFHQRWRAPLRTALDSLRSTLDLVFTRESASLLKDAWAALDDYISVILERTRESRERFLAKHARQQLTPGERVNAWRLLEMERHAALMYTSCGWFFDDISNIETVKIIEYAARAIQLARDVSGVDLEPEFVEALKGAPGNKAHLSDGARVYQEMVKPSLTDLRKGLAHYAISSLVEEYASDQRIFSFEFERVDYRRQKTTSRTLAVGAVNVRSATTREQFDGIFAALHLGGYDFHCAVRERVPAHDYEALRSDLFRCFEDSTRGLLQAIDTRLGGDGFALKDLFIDERRKIGQLLLKDALDRSREHYRRIYEESRDLMRLLTSLKIPPPESLRLAAGYVLSHQLEQACSQLKSEALRESEFRETAASVFREAESLGCKLDQSSLRDALQQAVHSRLTAYASFGDVDKLQSAAFFLRLAQQLRVELHLWPLQNLFWKLLAPELELEESALLLIKELADMLWFSASIVDSRLEKLHQA